jgi:hypothetical protein
MEFRTRRRRQGRSRHQPLSRRRPYTNDHINHIFLTSHDGVIVSSSRRLSFPRWWCYSDIERSSFLPCSFRLCSGSYNHTNLAIGISLDSRTGRRLSVSSEARRASTYKCPMSTFYLLAKPLGTGPERRWSLVSEQGPESGVWRLGIRYIAEIGQYRLIPHLCRT